MAISRKRIALAFAAAAVFAVWIAIAPSLADFLVVERPFDTADAIIVLSGAADYAQRARGASDAFKSGVAPLVMITDDDQRGGWDDREQGNPYFVERMRRNLIAGGVPPDAIEQLPGKVYGTSDEAAIAVKTARERGFFRVVVVTSLYHSRRSLWTFEKFAAENDKGPVIGLLCAPAGVTYPDRFTWWLTPRGWRTVGMEYVKLAWYWLYY